MADSGLAAHHVRKALREFLEILLKRQGHQVRLAKDAIEAVARLKDDAVDLVAECVQFSTKFSSMK